jgi:hypothetical protein
MDGDTTAVRTVRLPKSGEVGDAATESADGVLPVKSANWAVMVAGAVTVKVVDALVDDATGPDQLENP